MKNKRSLVVKSSIALLFVCMSVSLYWLMQSNASYRKEITEVIQREKKAQNETEEIEEQPTTRETVYSTKEGKEYEALEKTTNELFKIVYDYESDVDTIQTRSEKAKKYTTTNAHESLFPEDATQGTVTVQTSSKLTQSPEIFLMVDEEELLHALVNVSFAFSVAGSEDIQSSLLYKIEFQPRTKIIHSVKNLGQLPLLEE